MNKLIILTVFLLVSCFSYGPYHNGSRLKPDNWQEAQYIHNGDSLKISARLNSYGMLGDVVEVYVANTSSKPIPLNAVYDALTIQYEGKTYALARREPKVIHYPNILNPDSYLVTIWQGDGRFTDRLHLAESFRLNINRQTYTISPNETHQAAR